MFKYKKYDSKKKYETKIRFFGRSVFKKRSFWFIYRISVPQTSIIIIVIIISNNGWSVSLPAINFIRHGTECCEFENSFRLIGIHRKIPSSGAAWPRIGSRDAPRDRVATVVTGGQSVIRCHLATGTYKLSFHRDGQSLPVCWRCLTSKSAIRLRNCWWHIICRKTISVSIWNLETILLITKWETSI